MLLQYTHSLRRFLAIGFLDIDDRAAKLFMRSNMAWRSL